MLQPTTSMKRALALVVSIVGASAAGTAHAGTYVGLGIGTTPALSDDTGRLDTDGRSGKLILGNSFGRLALEGTVTKFGVTRTNSAGAPQPFGDAYQAGIALKAAFPLDDHFEVFGRAGLQHMWLNATKDSTNDTEGNGYLIGAGVQYKLDLGVGGGALFLDYQINNADLEGDHFTFASTTSRVWMLGLTVGI